MRTSRHRLREQQDRLLRMLPEVCWRLRHIPSISNVGVGAKEVGGEITGEFAFRVYVTLKLPHDDVPRSSRIPERISGVLTDVLPTLPTEALQDVDDERKLRPVKGGIQIKNQYVDVDFRPLSGTIGCLAKDINTLEVMALSCEHVLLAGQAAIGTEVGQPMYKTCCCCSWNSIGTVVRALKNDQVDCGIVRLDDDIAFQVDVPELLNEVEEIGRLTGVAQAVCFETVRKRGRTSGLTEGTVVEVVLETSQILIRPTVPPVRFALRGDSGSVVVNASNEVIGLLWATDAISRTRGIANHIGPVMQEMGIIIAGQTNAGLTIPTARCP